MRQSTTGMIIEKVKRPLILINFFCLLTGGFFLLNPQPLGAIDNLRMTPVVRAVNRVSPAVVNISTEEIIRSNPFISGDPLTDSFFRNFFDARPLQRSRQSLGSGIIIDTEGHVITNEHVIARATNIAVTLADNRTFSARVLGSDPDFDVAVLRLTTDEKLPYVSLGISSDLMPGETVIAIGNPFGLSHTVTTGVISAINRSIRSEKRVYEDFIQTDAAINPGNSGGPLININGELIGINTAIYQEGEGIGFAIPIDKVKLIAEDLLAYGKVDPAYIGITVQDFTPELQQSLGSTARRGAVVMRVYDNSPADGKLLPGDIITEINGGVVDGRRGFFAHSNGLVAGERVQFKIARDGKTQQVSLVTVRYPLKRAAQLAWELLGIEVDDYGRGGVVVTRVNPRGTAGYIGVHTGDLIYQVGDRETKSKKVFFEALVHYRNASSLFLVIGRGRYAYRVTIPLG